jgi:protein tyrosine phosphatase (PTP) superfamily phosphohydrolase (DUF442 family)
VIEEIKGEGADVAEEPADEDDDEPEEEEEEEEVRHYHVDAIQIPSTSFNVHHVQQVI